MTLKLAILSLFLHIITFAFKRYENNKLFYHLAIGSLIIFLFTTLFDFSTIREGYNLIFFSANLRASRLIFGLQFFIIFITLVLITIYKDYKFKPEFYILLSTNILAILFILQSNNFLIFFIAWEIFNLSLYAIIIGNNVDRQKALSASLKYFTLSAFSTAFLLLGLALIYHSNGDLSFENLYKFIYLKDMNIGIICIIFAIIFKLGAVPLHFWAPDLYNVTPLPIMAYVANVPKVLYFAVILIIISVCQVHSNLYPIFGVISLIIGSLGLMQQNTIKRFLAFSAITNVGYILLIIEYQNEAIYNIALYILPNINLFMVLIAINNYYNKEDINNIRELSGFFENNPFMLLTFVISIFSIAGVPPLPGFFAKYNLLVLAFNTVNHALFFIIIITSVIAVASYLKVLYIALFSNKVNKSNIKIDNNIVLTTIIAFNFVTLGILSYNDIISTLVKIIT